MTHQSGTGRMFCVNFLCGWEIGLNDYKRKVSKVPIWSSPVSVLRWKSTADTAALKMPRGARFLWAAIHRHPNPTNVGFLRMYGRQWVGWHLKRFLAQRRQGREMEQRVLWK